MRFREKITAFVAPMVAFIACLGVGAVLPWFGDSFSLQHPQYWVFPFQTLVCGIILVRYWSAYELGTPRQAWFGLAIGLLVFLLWIAPQSFLGFAPRVEGFNPEIFKDRSAVFGLTVAFRFLRLVVVVPLLEEIFWRGFLLRYLIDEKFDRIPFGSFSWLSFVIVTLAFALSHSVSDWPAAVVTGVLYNVVAYRTKSLSTCVITHALTNLLLGIWIMATRQWGFW